MSGTSRTCLIYHCANGHLTTHSSIPLLSYDLFVNIVGHSSPFLKKLALITNVVFDNDIYRSPGPRSTYQQKVALSRLADAVVSDS